MAGMGYWGPKYVTTGEKENEPISGTSAKSHQAEFPASYGLLAAPTAAEIWALLFSLARAFWYVNPFYFRI